MRPELLHPQGELTPCVLLDMLSLIGLTLPPGQAERWNPLERAVMFDWAAREHLFAADARIMRRVRPSLLDEREGVLAVLRDMHSPVLIYRECSHLDREDDGHLTVELDDFWTCEASYLHAVCRECCCHGGDTRSDGCAAGHHHGEGKPVCATRAVLDGTG
jgi:hypothetical protein